MVFPSGLAGAVWKFGTAGNRRGVHGHTERLVQSCLIRKDRESMAYHENQESVGNEGAPFENAPCGADCILEHV